jgi:hypothetical protein
MPENTSGQLNPISSGYVPPAARETLATTKAKAAAAEKMERIKLLSIVSLTLIIGGLAAWYMDPASAKDLWLIIGPILSSTFTVLAAGEKKSKSN